MAALFKRHRLLLGGLALVLAVWCWQSRNSRFTPERWAAAGEGGRAAMAEDLLEQYDGLAGMTREEVLALLGPDTGGGQREERLTLTGSQVRELLVYPLGGRLTPEYLLLYLEGGVVTEGRILVD